MVSACILFTTCFFTGNTMAWNLKQNQIVASYSLDFINKRVYFTSESGNEFNYKWSSSEIDVKAKSFLSVFMAAKASGAKVSVYYDGNNPYVSGSTTRWNVEQITVK